MKLKLVSSLTLSLCLAAGSALAGFQWVAPQNNVTAKTYESPAPVHDFPEVAPPAQDQIAADPAPAEMIKMIEEGAPSPKTDLEVQTKVIMPDDAPAGAKSFAEEASKKAPKPASAQPAPAAQPRVVLSPNAPVTAQAYADQMNDVPPPPASTDIPQAGAPLTAGMYPAAVAAMPPPPAVSSKAPITSFGSDIPLAMALQDIIPSSYSFGYQAGVNPGTVISWNARNEPWDLVLASVLAEKNLGFIVQGQKVLIRPAVKQPALVQLNPYPLGAPVQPQAQPQVIRQVKVNLAQPAPKAGPVIYMAPETTMPVVPRANLSGRDELIIIPSQQAYYQGKDAMPPSPSQAPVAVAPSYQPQVIMSPSGQPTTITRPLTPSPFQE